jgi:hypothetical protein
MPTTFDELVARSRSSATGDDGWLGSDDHLALLSSALEPVFGLPDVSLHWGAPGSAGYWEPASRKIMLERPVALAGVTTEDIANATALSLLHESLHARHSTPFRSYPRARERVEPGLRRAVERLFNLLEDGRITACGIAERPELSAPLQDFLDKSASQITREDEGRFHRSPETTEPASQSNQLFFALQMRALRPDCQLVLHPGVAERLVSLQSLMSEAQGGSTEDCGLAAVRVVQHVMASGLPS